MERLDRPDKHWKYNPGDVDERQLWPQYMDAYQTVFDRTSTELAEPGELRVEIRRTEGTAGDGVSHTYTDIN